MNYESFTNSIIDTIKGNNLWDRVVSLDFETKVLAKSDMLSGERILGIGVARRIVDKVDIKTFILEEDNDESEVKILKELGDYFYQTRPLVIMGYGIGTYDHGLMILKIKKLDEWFKTLRDKGEDAYFPGYWAIRDAFIRGHVLDMINPIRFEIANHDDTTAKFLGLDKVVVHQRFSYLPLMRTKSIVSDKTDFFEKGKVIYELWKNDREKFRKYLEGDVHDPLVIAEDIFKIKDFRQEQGKDKRV